MASTKMQLKISARLMNRLDQAAEDTGINRAELVRHLIDEGLARRSTRGADGQPSKREAAREVASRWVPQGAEDGDRFWRTEAWALVAALWMWSTSRQGVSPAEGMGLDGLIEKLRCEARQEHASQALGNTVGKAQAQAGLDEEDVIVLRGWARRAASERRGILSAIVRPGGAEEMKR